jgi:hypothetical protein
MKMISKLGGIAAGTVAALSLTAIPASALSQAWAHGNFNPNTDSARICDDSGSAYQNAKIEWWTGSARNYHTIGANGGCNQVDHAYVAGAIIRWRVCAGSREGGQWVYSCTPEQLTYSTS